MMFQRTPSHKLLDIYSVNPKVNSIIRTLIALHGKTKLWDAVTSYVLTKDANELTHTETWELYQAAKWVERWGDK